MSRGNLSGVYRISLLYHGCYRSNHGIRVIYSILSKKHPLILVYGLIYPIFLGNISWLDLAKCIHDIV